MEGRSVKRCKINCSHLYDSANIFQVTKGNGDQLDSSLRLPMKGKLLRALTALKPSKAFPVEGR